MLDGLPANERKDDDGLVYPLSCTASEVVQWITKNADVSLVRLLGMSDAVVPEGSGGGGLFSAGKAIGPDDALEIAHRLVALRLLIPANDRWGAQFEKGNDILWRVLPDFATAHVSHAKVMMMCNDSFLGTFARADTILFCLVVLRHRSM